MKRILTYLGVAVVAVILLLSVAATVQYQSPTGRGSDWTIAANDAPLNWKFQADYILGSGEDLSVAVENAWAAGNLNVQLSKGTFAVETALDGVEGCSLSGMGKDTTLTWDHTLASVINFSGLTWFELHDFKLSIDTVGAGGASGTINIYNCGTFDIDGVHIINSSYNAATTQVGIYIDSNSAQTPAAQIRNGTIQAVAYGIYIGDTATYDMVKIHDMVFRTSKYQAIYLERALDTTIYDCWFYICDMSGTSGAIYQASGSGTTTIENIIIAHAGNSAAVTSYGICVAGGGLLLSDSHIVGSAGPGLYAVGTTAMVVVNGCDFNGNGYNTAGTDANRSNILIDTGAKVSVNGSNMQTSASATNLRPKYHFYSSGGKFLSVQDCLDNFDHVVQVTTFYGYATNPEVLIFKGNRNYIGSGEIRTVSKPITGGAMGTVTSIQNLFGGDVLITEAYISLTAESADAPTYDMGTDDDGAGAPSVGNNLFEAVADTAGYYSSTVAASGGTQTVPIVWPTTGNDWVNFIITDANGVATAGVITITVIGK